MVDTQGTDLLRVCQLWVTTTLAVGRPPPALSSSRLRVQHTSGGRAITAIMCAQGYFAGAASKSRAESSSCASRNSTTCALDALQANE